ncbi:MAG TPA: aminotransferase class IV [Cyclobacteriaceae bacterium]|jgi:4-amino-4-deoxychorismate lyase
MSLLIETIRCQDGVFHNLEYHQRRVDHAFRSLFDRDPHNLARLLESVTVPSSGWWKCRIEYDAINTNVELTPYTPRRVETLLAVRDDSIAYSHKFRDRSAIERWFASRGTCDDILIVRNDEITDSSIANIAFRHNDKWFTPANPLLPGTQRQFLIDSGKIQPIVIRKEDVLSFESFRLINAMIGFEAPEQPVSNIVWQF